jgi:hypothetical protein
MDRHVSYLTALLPPGNIVSSVEEFRSKIAEASVPIRSLPPILVLRGSAGDPGTESLSGIAMECSATYRTTGVSFRKGSVYLRVSPAPPVRDGPSVGPLPPPFPGLWVSPLVGRYLDTSEGAEDGELSLPYPEVGWGVSRIVILRVETGSDPWWKTVQWRIIAERATLRPRA